MSTLAIIDYGMGNLRSVAKALEHVAGGRVQVRVSGEPEVILAADRVLFPGVGAIRDCMAELNGRGLADVVRRCAADRPFLGICLGMQALMDTSEENQGTDCLGILPGRVRRFPADLRDADGERLKVPHMGWNQVHEPADHPLWRGISQDSWFYFVHSFYVEPAEPDLVAGTTRHGIDFASVVASGNVFACQFHPEKSQHAGLRLLANFVAWDGKA
jgi:glutamine amidotransferase